MPYVAVINVKDRTIEHISVNGLHSFGVCLCGGLGLIRYPKIKYGEEKKMDPKEVMSLSKHTHKQTVLSFLCLFEVRSARVCSSNYRLVN